MERFVLRRTFLFLCLFLIHNLKHAKSAAHRHMKRSKKCNIYKLNIIFNYPFPLPFSYSTCTGPSSPQPT